MSLTATLTHNDQQDTLGLPVPPFTAHAISVSLPTWKDNVGYEEGEKRVVDLMVSGYPRFFIHLSIQKVRRSLYHGEQAMLACMRQNVPASVVAGQVTGRTRWT